MTLRIGKLYFDWWTMGVRSIDHRPGVVALVARSSDPSAKTEVFEAHAAHDMNATATALAEQGRLRRDEPGRTVGLMTRAAERLEAVGIVGALLRRKRVFAEPVFDGDVARMS